MAGILIVDDRPQDRKLVAEKLSLDGHQVTAIADAAITCASVRSLEPDMVLLNALSSRFDCLQVLIRIKRDYPWLPVIAYSLRRLEALDRVTEAVDGLVKDLRPAVENRRFRPAGLKILKKLLDPLRKTPLGAALRPACPSSGSVPDSRP